MLYILKGFGVDLMQQVSNEHGFQIIIQSDGAEDASKFWQDQCWYLYDEIYRTLPEGSIEPLTHGGDEEAKFDIIVLFSTLVVSGISGKIFTSIVIGAIKNWLDFRPTADIEVKCPDGNIIKITKLPLSRLPKFFDEHPELPICEALSRFANSIE